MLARFEDISTGGSDVVCRIANPIVDVINARVEPVNQRCSVFWLVHFDESDSDGRSVGILML